MKLTVQREVLLKPLQSIIGAVEKRHTMAVLSNVLLTVTSGTLKLTATDLELELVATLPVKAEGDGAITVPARKFVDICRGLPDQAVINISSDNTGKVTIKSGRNRFVLSSLPATDFPSFDSDFTNEPLLVSQKAFLTILRQTSFSMAQQDVRYFLNGMLLEVKGGQLRAVATDGHRLATADVRLSAPSALEKQVIIPRKAVLELIRLCEENDQNVSILLGDHHIRVSVPHLTITSKLIDGRYPDYTRVIPAKGQNILTVDRDQLKQALSLVAILSNEKYRAVRLRFDQGVLGLAANNPEQEQAENEMEVHYEGKPLEVGFNVGYMLDILGVLPAGMLEVSLVNANSSALLHQKGNDKSMYVVMPIRL
jgi:DNA polymerase-3 subunit beta